MKAMMPILFVLAMSAAQAHESLAPHQHPHATSWLPSMELVGVAALILMIAAIAIGQIRRGVMP